MEQYSEQQTEFIKRYIRPFYMDLMKMNFVGKSQEYTDELFFNLQTTSTELKNEEIIKMLNDSWRPSKVGAWMIGVGNRLDLKLELLKYLNKVGNHYCEHVLFNYYLLEGKDSAIELKNYINREINFITTSEEAFLEIERISIHWAIAILKHIDKEYSTNNVKEVKISTTWNSFISTIRKLNTNEHLLKMYDSNYYLETIEESIKRVKN